MTKTRIMALGGLFTALSTLFMYLGSVMPINKIYLLGIASCIVPISILITDLKTSFVVYAASSILSILLLGLKGVVLAYIIFFGLYGFIKLYIEKLNKLLFEIPLKLCFFNLALVSGILLSKLFLVAIPTTKYSNYILFFSAQLIFLVYDYSLTVFISYFQKHYLKKFL